MTKKTAAEKPLRLTNKLLDERQRIIDELARITAQSAAKRQRLAQIEISAKAFLDSLGEDFATKGKYEIEYEICTGRVAWKDAYIAATSADSAARLQLKAPATRKLRITKT